MKSVDLMHNVTVTMTQISPYLLFNGNCREAMTFYKLCLGGKLILQTVNESPMKSQWPKSVQNHILHASLTKATLSLLASDMAGTDGLVRGNTISLALNCSTEKEIETYFINLSKGGKITHPLHKFFDGTIGALTDKFGTNWLFKL